MKIQPGRSETMFNLFTGIVTVVVQLIVGFFLSPFIVRTLGAEANGFSQLANNFVMYASLLTLAFNSMAARFVSVSYHQGDIEKAQKYYSSVIIANIAIVLFLLPLTVLLVIYLDGVIVIKDAKVLDVQLLFAFVFLNFFLNLFISVYSIAMFVKNQIFFTNILNAARTILNAILLLVVFSIFPPHIFFISFVAVVLTIIFLPVYSRLKKKLLPEVRFHKKDYSSSHLKELFSSGIWNTINQGGHMLNTGLDLLLSNWFISPYSMGLLAVSKTVPTAIIQLASTINSNFAPSIVELWAKNDPQRLLHELRVSIKISMILVSIPIVTFCCFGYDFYKLWQPTLDAKTLSILSILGLMAFIPVAGTQTLYNIFTATNHLKVNSLSFVITGILNIILVILSVKLFPQYGIYFIAGISSVLSILRLAIIILPYEAKLLNLKWYEFFKDVGWTLVCCLVNVIFALPFILFYHIDGWIGLVIMIVITASITFIADLFLFLSKNERGSILRILKIR